MHNEKLTSGQLIAARYALQRELHRSNHSAVWLAQDQSLGHAVALKIATDNSAVARELLRNEAQLARRCKHPNVIDIYDHHDESSSAYLVVEYLPNGSLSAMMGQPATQFLPPMIDIATALAHVHRQGLVHRDVKLSNCLLDARGHARLVDFGIASPKGEEGLRTGGSPRSMSPQQQSGECPEATDDTYAFGTALFRLHKNRWPTGPTEQVLGSSDLVTLINELRHPQATQRPSDWNAIIQRLRLTMNEQHNVTLPPDEFLQETEAPDEVIEVIDLPSREASHAAPASNNGGREKRTLALLALYGVIGAAALFYFLPRMASERPEVASNQLPVGSQTPAVTASTAARAPLETASSDSAANVEPWQLAQQAKFRKDAEEVLERLLEKQFYLEGKEAHLWAGAQMETLKASAIAGDKLFRRDEFAQALTQYEQGLVLATSLAERAETILEDTLAAGDAGLAAADSATARAQFQLALGIDSSSTRAQQGLDRAENLDQVITLVTQAEDFERSEQHREAMKIFKQAQELDPSWGPANNGVQRMQRHQVAVSYRNHMANGYSALERKDFAEAQAAFERAQRLRPNSNEVTQANEQLATAIRLEDVVAMRGRAEELERRGDLRGAEREYSVLLAKDRSQQQVQERLQRVREHADIDEQLTQLLAQPARLSSDSVYRQAQTLLERVDPYMTDPQIATRSAQLRTLMQQSQMPLPVRLVSDGSTDVLVYRVGRLGAFTNEVLELRPGEYTAIGTRAGYRDVRVNFTITPGQAGAQVQVVCQERI